MEYKGYVGTFEFDERRELFVGRVTNSAPITFHGKSVESLKYTFRDAVDEYLAWCGKLGRGCGIVERSNPQEGTEEEDG